MKKITLLTLLIGLILFTGCDKSIELVETTDHCELKEGDRVFFDGEENFVVEVKSVLGKCVYSISDNFESKVQLLSEQQNFHSRDDLETEIEFAERMTRECEKWLGYTVQVCILFEPNEQCTWTNHIVYKCFGNGFFDLSNEEGIISRWHYNDIKFPEGT